MKRFHKALHLRCYSSPRSASGSGSLMTLFSTSRNYFNTSLLFLRISQAYPNTSENYFDTTHSFYKLLKLNFYKFLKTNLKHFSFFFLKFWKLFFETFQLFFLKFIKLFFNTSHIFFAFLKFPVISHLGTWRLQYLFTMIENTNYLNNNNLS